MTNLRVGARFPRRDPVSSNRARSSPNSRNTNGFSKSVHPDCLRKYRSGLYSWICHSGSSAQCGPPVSHLAGKVPGWIDPPSGCGSCAWSAQGSSPRIPSRGDRAQTSFFHIARPEASCPVKYRVRYTHSVAVWGGAGRGSTRAVRRRPRRAGSKRAAARRGRTAKTAGCAAKASRVHCGRGRVDAAEMASRGS
jgi:hypothetical protein